MRNWGRSGRTRYPEIDAYVFGFHQVEPSVEWMLVRSGTVTPGCKAWYRTTNKDECLSRKFRVANGAVRRPGGFHRRFRVG